MHSVTLCDMTDDKEIKESDSPERIEKREAKDDIPEDQGLFGVKKTGSGNQRIQESDGSDESD